MTCDGICALGSGKLQVVGVTKTPQETNYVLKGSAVTFDSDALCHAWTARGSLLLGCESGELLVYDAESGKLVLGPEGAAWLKLDCAIRRAPSSLPPLCSSLTLMLAHGWLIAHSAPTSQPLRAAPPRRDIGMQRDIIALACADGCARFVSHPDTAAATQALCTLLLELPLAPPEEPAELLQVQWSPDYLGLIAVASDANLYHMEVFTAGLSSAVRVEVTAELWSSYHLGPITGVAALAGGTRFASTGDDGTVRIWDVERRELMERVLVGSKQTALGARSRKPTQTLSCPNPKP